LVTGATGFVGEALVLRLLLDGLYTPVAAVRGQTRLLGLCPVVTFELAKASSLPSLNDIEVVVHTAARVHVMREAMSDALSEFRRVNVEGTVRLARKAAESGVRRFVFISSIKVNGEETLVDRPFRADDVPAPVDPYGISKKEAEDALLAIGRETGMEIVIIRPPLVYGPGVKANFSRMMGLLTKRLPLPLGTITNRRSLVGINNLVDLIVVCLDHAAAKNETFLVSDDKDFSTSELLRCLRRELGGGAILLPFPGGLLKSVSKLMGCGAVAQRLCGSLQVDVVKTRETLQWRPPYSPEVELRRTAIDYLETH
jgi:nucleoside-diphosphate-sugar epimerase